jgi:SET domain-containing protein
MILPILFIAPSHNKGRGVYTSEKISAGSVIEMSPVIVFSAQDRKAIEESLLYHYIFEWGDDRKKGALGLGYISMYNHSYNANCVYEMDYDAGVMSIRTVRNIKAGEELYINYNAVPDDETPLWFDAV